MKKLLTLSTLIAAAFAFNVQAASHAGAAPMKASEPAAKASDAKKADKDMKKEEKKTEKK
jgi:hypothetical protein